MICFSRASKKLKRATYISFTIRNLNGGQHKVSLDPKTTIDCLKQKIEKHWLSVPTEHQRLIYQGKELKTGTIEEAGIASDTVLFLAVTTTYTFKTLKEERYQLRLSSGSTVSDVKHKLLDSITPPHGSFSLIANGRILVDDMTLKDAAIKSNETIWIV